MDLCQYQHMFGEPNQGIHRFRLGGIAVVDVLFTLMGAFFLSFLMRWNVVLVTIGMFVLGIIMHRLFCVRTTVDRLLF